MRIFLFVLIFSWVNTLYAACSYIPNSLVEAEAALAYGEIDTICFFEYRSLILQPTQPLREGWDAILELSDHFEGRTFPSVAEIRAVPGDKRMSWVIQEYPWLQEYRLLFTFEEDSVAAPVTGVVSSSVSSGYFNSDAVGHLNFSLMSRHSETGGALSLVQKGRVVTPERRRFSLGDRTKRLYVDIGNFRTVQRSLLWGAFIQHNDESSLADQLLYGTRDSWNGVRSEVRIGRGSSQALFHRRLDELFTGGEYRYEFSRISLGGGVYYHKSREQEELMLTFNIAASDKRRVEIIGDAGGGVACIASGRAKGDLLSIQGEVWWMNALYNSSYSRTVQDLKRIYERVSGTALGYRSRLEFPFALFRFSSRFEGEVVRGAGRGDLSLQLSSRKLWNMSVKSRNEFFLRGNSTESHWQQMVNLRPKVKQVSFPLIGTNSIKESMWDFSGCGIGVEVKPSQFYFASTGWYRWYRSRESYSKVTVESGVRGKRGRCSMALSIPFNRVDEMELHGKVELSW